MYHYKKPIPTTLRVNHSKEGETIEQKMRRVMSNQEPINEGSPIIFTTRDHGIDPDHDIRTDKWEHAVEAKSQYDIGNKKDRQAKVDALKQKNAPQKPADPSAEKPAT